MSSRIICGVDASPASASAAAVAARLGSVMGMECLLLHVEPPGRRPVSIAHARERGRVAALAEANDFSSGVHTEVIAGDPDTGLAAAAESGDVELLVMGTSGPAPAAPDRGGVPARVIQRASCPVVLVPPRVVPPFAPDGVRSLVCVLSEDRDNDDVLDLSMSLATRLGAEHHGARGVPGARYRADLIVLAAPAQGAWTVVELANELSCPIVVLPPAARVGLMGGMARSAA